jgi:PhoH-like ATPase
MAKKNYVLDTNILLGSNGPLSIFGFDDNNVIITGTTLQELDKKKSERGEIGYNARRVCHILEDLRQKGNLANGVTLDSGGAVFIVNNSEKNLLPSDYLDSPDNRIINTCLNLKNTSNYRVVLVTNDVSMRINASICNLEVESYRNDHIDTDNDYTGKTTLEIDETHYEILKRYDNLEVSSILGKAELVSNVLYMEEKLYENEFITIQCKDNPELLCIYRQGKISRLNEGMTRAFSVIPRNNAQAYALYALMAPVEDIPLVILRGSAGTAKTFLSLAAGLEQVYDDPVVRRYNKVLISRNNVTADAEFGALPGDLSDKMMPLLAPFYDNLETLLRLQGPEETKEIQMQIDDLFASHVIDICPLAYMRGRSITHSYLIVDEVQNATQSQIRDIITRAGEGTKIVLCGDPYQVDNHLLDRRNNGLVYAAEKMKDSPLCAQIMFGDEESVRSDLVKEALTRLTF